MSDATRARGGLPLLELATGLARVWVALYTGLLHVAVRDSRRAELESDLWEHGEYGRQAGLSPRATAAELLIRVLVGMPDDLIWRFGAGAAESRAARRRDPAEGRHLMRIAEPSRVGPLALLSGVLVMTLVAFILVTIRLFPGDSSLPRVAEVVFWLVAAGTAGVVVATVIGLLQFEGITRVGRAGLKIFIVGAMVAAVSGLLAVVRVPGSWLLLAPAYILAFVGWMMFAVTNLGSRSLPRWNVLPLVIGLIPVGITVVEYLEMGGSAFLQVGITAFAVSWLLLSVAVWSRDGAST